MTSNLIATLAFTGPFDFASQEWRSNVGLGAIVYMWQAWLPDGTEPRPIARAGGTDPLGILDIGETGRGVSRLNELYAAATGKPSPHRAGLEYSRAWYNFDSTFPLQTLRIKVLAVPSKALAETIELALLEEYRWTYKDRPPLNSSAGKYAKVVKWLASKGRTPRKNGWLNLDGLIGAVERTK